MSIMQLLHSLGNDSDEYAWIINMNGLRMVCHLSINSGVMLKFEIYSMHFSAVYIMYQIYK